MAVPHCLGHHSASNRDVYLLTLNDLDTPFALPDIQGHQFTCFCALNAEGLPADELGKFCSHLLQLGCSYLCTWGPDCERVHDIMDEEIVGNNPAQSDLGCVMTTWRPPRPRHGSAAPRFFGGAGAKVISPDTRYNTAAWTHASKIQSHKSSPSTRASCNGAPFWLLSCAPTITRQWKRLLVPQLIWMK